jgi:hypothetical protein
VEEAQRLWNILKAVASHKSLGISGMCSMLDYAFHGETLLHGYLERTIYGISEYTNRTCCVFTVTHHESLKQK